MMCTQAEAVWSAFAHVTPDAEAQYGIDVLVQPAGAQEEMFRVRVDAIEYEHKHAWLVVAGERLSSSGQELRNEIWGLTPSVDKVVLVKAELQPFGEAGELYYEIELSADIIQRAYIYIDFPSLTADGGYYYSIDLPAYLEAHRSRR